MRKPKIENPKVFISYAWTSDTYVNKVAAFANSLMRNGIDVLFDKFEMKPGHELNHFMEKSVTDPTVTNVLLLLNKTYQEKADKREGGVGKETQILSEKLYNDVSQTKIIPIIFEKGINGEIYKPAYIGSTYYIDLADDNKYDAEFQQLVKAIYGETTYRKPELGNIPAWVTEEITFEPKLSLQYSSFRNQNNKEVNDQNFISFLDEIKDEILNYKTDDIDRSNIDSFYPLYLDKYKGLLSIRNKYLELIKYSIYVNVPEKKIAHFFENLYNGIQQIEKGFPELFSILLHEIFIYTIAYFLKFEKYEKISYFLGKTYCITTYESKLSTYYAFYSSKQDLFDAAVRARDNKNYYTGVGNYWIENFKVDFCTQEDFTLADILCFNYYLFGSPTDLDLYWFPITYIYGSSRFSSNNVLRIFAEKLKTKEFLDNAIILFNYNKEAEFISRYKEVEMKFQEGNLREYRYASCFDSVPVLCEYTKSTELGKYR